MDSLLDNLGNAKYLSKIDLKQPYHQIPLEESSKEVTAFAILGKGLFQFTRLPYGLRNAPASFQRAMDNIFEPEWQPQVFVYMDDIIIASKNLVKKSQHSRYSRRSPHKYIFSPSSILPRKITKHLYDLAILAIGENQA